MIAMVTGMRRAGGRVMVMAVLLLVVMGLPMAAGGVIAGDGPVQIDGDNLPPAYPVKIRAFRCGKGGGQTRQQLLQHCKPLNGVYFELTRASIGLEIADGYTGESGPGQLLWPRVLPGGVLIHEDAPAWAGVPKVYCGVAHATGTAPASYGTMAVDDDTIFYDIEHDDYLFCDWFNMPLKGS